MDCLQDIDNLLLRKLELLPKTTQFLPRLLTYTPQPLLEEPELSGQFLPH